MSRSPRRIGYARVSTKTQAHDRQLIQLEDACDELHLEKLSAVATDRPTFDAVIASLQDGDTFVVLDLDRAFRSSIDAILTAQMLRDRGVRFRLLNFPIDTASDEGELFYTILAAFAQFERRMISRRTKEGLQAAKLFNAHRNLLWVFQIEIYGSGHIPPNGGLLGRLAPVRDYFSRFSSKRISYLAILD